MELPEHPSPEQIEQIRALLEQGGGMFGQPPDGSIKGLCDAHPDLTKSLEEFDLASAVRLIASLETIPALLGNTIRIEVLLHLAVNCCKGNRSATPIELRAWVTHLKESPMATQEDPPEDVFVGYVCTRHGGFRVLPGIFSHADFILERLLRFLGEKIEFPGFLGAYESVLNLLKISESISTALGLARYSACDTEPEESLLLPPAEQLELRANALHFDQSRLDQLGVDLAKLKPFFFDQSHAETFANEPLFGSSLELHPLLSMESGVLVASPTSLCRAAVVHILGIASGQSGWSNTFFEIESAHFFINRILNRIGIEHINIKLPPTPASLPPLYPYPGQFDYGMPALGLILSSPLTTGTDLEEFESFTPDQVKDLTQYISDCCAALEAVEGFKGGLVLLAMSSVGRPIGFGIGDLRPEWKLFSTGLGDWQTLAGDEDFKAKRLWYLGLQQDLAEAANIETMNISGLLNLYGFWKQQDFELIPREMDPRNPHNLLVIDGSYSKRINVELKSLHDRHCRLYHGGTSWVKLHRQGAGLNPDLNTNLRYCDYSAAGQGILRGCIALQDTSWWIEADSRPKDPSSRSLVFRLWDCVFSWAERTLSKLAEIHPDWIQSNLKVELDFPGIEKWNVTGVPESSEKLGNLGVDIDRSSASARLTFGEAFLRNFYRPDNVAEREIVAALIRATAETKLDDAQVEECVGQVTKNENTRFFHIVRALTLETAIGGPESAKPALIPKEEIARIEASLAYTAIETPPQKITNSNEAREFLDKLVAAIQARLCARLKEFWILPIVSYSFSQLDELSRDGSRWSLSTRSLLSLEDGSDWLRARLRTESGRLALAEIANRALIETAAYSFNPEATEIISQTEHASLLAEFAVMIQLANYRDAVANGFVDAAITIHPNGAVEFDDLFQQDVFQPYLTARIDDKIQWDADAYDNNFEVPDKEAETAANEHPEVVAFEKAFSAEFGFPYETIVKVINHFDEMAIARGDAGGTVDFPTLSRVLRDEIGLSQPQVAIFLERFVLPIRPAWNKKFPTGCGVNDVLPWRFYRGLSILVRPFVEVSRTPKQYAISASHLHRWRRYLTHSISQGHLAERLFRSNEMKSYLGSVAHKKGHDFEKKVGAAMGEIISDIRVGIQMTELGAPADPDLGDIDVLAWNSKSRTVMLVECKRLKTALTVPQAIQQLEEFRGDAANPEDSLAKHQRRVNWLKENPEGISKITGIPREQILWTSLLVTSGRVPMSYLDTTSFSKDQAIPFQELEVRIRSFAEGVTNAPS